MISAKMETTAEMGATEEGTFQHVWYSFYTVVIHKSRINAWKSSFPVVINHKGWSCFGLKQTKDLPGLASNTTQCSIGIGRVCLPKQNLEVLKNSCGSQLS